MIDLDYQEIAGLLLHSGGKEDYFYNEKFLVLLLCSIAKFNRRLEKYNKSRNTKDSEH